MYNENQNGDLTHHGIKGQRWGVRRFQNKDGSLTQAGRKRYDTDIEGAKEKVKKAKDDYNKSYARYNAATLYGSVYNQKAAEDLDKHARKLGYAKQDLQSEKIKDKLNNETKAKSDHRLKLEKQYLEKGMTQEEAEIAAYKRDKTEKVLATALGLSVAAATAYVAYKQYDKRVDKIIKAGTTLQNISSNSNKGVSDAFYSSMTKMDNAKYRGVYGDTIKNTGQKVYETKIGVNKNIKLASEKSAVSALKDLVTKDPDYAKDLRTHLEDSVWRYPLDKQQNTIRKGLESLKNGKVDSKVYEALNLSLVDHQLPTSSKINKGFYDQLKSKGYDAIMDINDKKLSGFHSSKPVIVFNGSAKTAVNSIREVGEQEIKNAKIKGMLDITVKSLAPSVAVSASSAALFKLGLDALETKSNDKIVRDYKKKHPNSELSYTEIVRQHKN